MWGTYILDVYAHATVPCRFGFTADTGPLHKADSASVADLNSEVIGDLADADADVDDSVDTGGSRHGISRSTSMNSDITQTVSGEGAVDGAFSSYVQLRNSARRQSLSSRLQKVNPVAIYKVRCQPHHQ